MSHEFETGPIRPPSEAASILLRVTRNCPWNKCAFCHTYAGEAFSRRSVDEIIADIDAMHAIALRLGTAAAHDADPRRLSSIIPRAMEGDDTPEFYYRQVAFWMGHGLRSMFLQDANSPLLPAAELVAILEHARKRFPSLERITSYARAKTIGKKTLAELTAIRNAGLDRLHIGMESGCDQVLELARKGVSAAEQIEAGRKAVAAGFDLSEYYMPGLGGVALSRENALESARVLNAINPAFIRLRSTVPLPGTPLYQAMIDGKWAFASEEDKLREIRLFIESLDGITSRIRSDHIMNLIEEIEGDLPGDKENMLRIIDSFLSMDADTRENFIIGRRLGYFRLLADYHPSPEIEHVKREIKRNFASLEAGILEIVKNYI